MQGLTKIVYEIEEITTNESGMAVAYVKTGRCVIEQLSRPVRNMGGAWYIAGQDPSCSALCRLLHLPRKVL